MINHYNVLGIENDASAEEIKKAYLKLTRRYHPDITGDTSGHFFKMIQEAYDVLRDDEKRKNYDVSEQQTTNNFSTNPDNTYPESNVKSEPEYHDANEIHWNRIAWRNKTFNTVEEKIITPKPGLWLGLGTLAGTLLLHSILAIIGSNSLAGDFILYTLFYMSGIAAVGFMIANVFQHRWMRNFLLASLTQTGMLVIGLTKGLKPETMGIQIASLVVSLLAGYLGYLAIKNLDRWHNFRILRRPMTFTPKAIREGRIWGEPGNLSDAIDKFGEANVEKGSLGEKKMAAHLEELLKIPGTRIFHGLKFPGSQVADVDHAVINGNKIVFIDSKMWTGGDFSWGAYDVILQQKKQWRTERSSNFSAAVNKLAQIAPEKTEVIGYICIYSNDNTLVTVDNSGHETALVQLATPETTIREIGNWFLDTKELGIIDRNLMNFLLYQMK